MAFAVDEKYYEELERKLERYIGEHKLRHTPERYTILRYACEEGKFKASAIVERAKTDFISRPTVYNTLRLLVSAQILWCQSGRGPSAEYEVISKAKVRMRLMCYKCGRTMNFRDMHIEEVIEAHHFRNFALSHFTLDVWGTCKECDNTAQKQGKGRRKRSKE